MFHRVKSEESEQDVDQKDVSTDNQTQTATQDESVKEKTVEESSASEKDQTSDVVKAEETTPSKPQQETSKKDTETMTEKDNAPEKDDAPAAGMSPYQQRPSQPAAVRGTYPGSTAYPGAASSASDASSSDRRLTIGPGITMSGEIESCDYLLVEGTVEAALKGANLLEVAESGVFYGTVEISEANISGRFEGDITVNGRLTITSTGTVTGSISYKEIEIEAGAVLDGKLTPLNAVAASAPAKKPQAAKAAKPSTPKVEKQPEPANTDEGLFSKAAAAAE